MGGPTLRRAGRDRIRVFELQNEVGGNAASGRNRVSAHPWGAHYLPLPPESLDDLIRFLTECGALVGRSAEGLPIYLRLLHTTIADAISWGCKSLSLGRTALEPKAALGAKPEPMSVWLRHRVPAMNWMMRGVLDAVTHDEAPERNPFKAAVESK